MECKMSKIKVVAEIGCNHNGDVNLAKEMMLVAKKAGVYAVKFQSFVPQKLVSKYAEKAEYQKQNDDSESQLKMLEKLVLTPSDYCNLLEYSQEIDLKMFSTPFDDESFDFLTSIGQNIWKIPSGEITNLPFLEKVANLKCRHKKIILSTGMSTVDEIKYAISILKTSVDTEFTLLHCNTQYPTLPQDMNLSAMNELKNIAPDWDIGLSDHSEGIVAALVAVGFGATFIEKHFTLDKNMSGPDHKASITPVELKELCENINTAEIMLGSDEKKVTQSESENIFVARKSIVAKHEIKKGDIFSPDNIVCKRPGNGISPTHWYEVIGKIADKDYYVDELIKCDGVKWENE